MNVFGVILAGGQNRRYGAHKALAEVGGEPIVERVKRALASVAPDVVMIANDANVYAGVGVPMRPDSRPGLGVLGGILTALEWARDAGKDGILAVACDMPFLSAPLLRLILEEAGAGTPPPDAVVPESESRRGVEPLCAYYDLRCIPAIEAEVARGDRHIVGFFGDIAVREIPLRVVCGFGDPAALFLNVNTPEERERAETVAAAGSHP